MRLSLWALPHLRAFENVCVCVGGGFSIVTMTWGLGGHILGGGSDDQTHGHARDRPT